MRTEPQRRGDAAEALVADRLAQSGWRILGRQVRVGRDELDIVAVDPGPPPALVGIEVRWRSSRQFGLPEETVDWRKRRRLARALLALSFDTLADIDQLHGLPVRLDLVAVEPGRPASLGPRLRHHRWLAGR